MRTVEWLFPVCFATLLLASCGDSFHSNEQAPPGAPRLPTVPLQQSIHNQYVLAGQPFDLQVATSGEAPFEFAVLTGPGAKIESGVLTASGPGTVTVAVRDARGVLSFVVCNFYEPLKVGVFVKEEVPTPDQPIPQVGDDRNPDPTSSPKPSASPAPSASPSPTPIGEVPTPDHGRDEDAEQSGSPGEDGKTIVDSGEFENPQPSSVSDSTGLVETSILPPESFSPSNEPVPPTTIPDPVTMPDPVTTPDPSATPDPYATPEPTPVPTPPSAPVVPVWPGTLTETMATSQVGQILITGGVPPHRVTLIPSEKLPRKLLPRDLKYDPASGTITTGKRTGAFAIKVEDAAGNIALLDPIVVEKSTVSGESQVLVQPRR